MRAVFAAPACLAVAAFFLSPAPALFAAPATGQSNPAFEDEVLVLVNQERWTNGQLPPLKRNDVLAAVALDHSTNMAERDFFAHCDLDTKEGAGTRVAAAGYAYNAMGENIAAGYQTPAQVMNGWMNSPGHRNNILNANFREIGVGYYIQSNDDGNVRFDSNGDCTGDTFNNGPYASYWTQDFGRVGSVYPVVINREAVTTASPDVDLYVYGEGWAQEMRFRNESGAWSAWEPYAADAAWTLSPGGGAKTVTVELRNGTTVRSASDEILLEGPVPVTLLAFSAGRTEEGVVVAWRVSGDTDLSGFDLYRAADGGDPVRVTETSLTGDTDYRVVDAAAPDGSLVYRLAEVSRTGETRWLASAAVAASSTPVPVLSSRPNPFFAEARITYSVPRTAPVRLAVYDVRGALVATLVDAVEGPGTKTVAWNGRTRSGAEASAGLYVLRLRVGTAVTTQKIVRHR